MNVLLIIHDNNSYTHYFPLGSAYLASIFKRMKCQVTIYNQAMHHYSEEHLTQYLDKYRFDIVGIGTIAGYYPYQKLLAISKAVNASVNRDTFTYLLGGHMVSADPSYFLHKTKADIVIRGEAEKTIQDILGGTHEEIKTIKGIIYREDDKTYKNPDRELIHDLDSIPFPSYQLFPMYYYRLQRFPNIEPTQFSMSIISGRGCSFHCTFCYRMMEGMRLRSISSIMEEITYLYKRWGVTYIDFADDLTMSSKQRAVELCEAFLKLDFKISWRCEGRLNYVEPEILDLMKRAGCVFINYGIESLDNTVLKLMKKALTKDMIIDGIEKTIAAKISPGLNIIWGNIGDNEKTLKESVAFLNHYSDFAQLRTISPVIPYPGCELFEEAKRLGKLKDTADFYENKYTNSDLLAVNFTELSDTAFYSCLYDANKDLLRNYYYKKCGASLDILQNLYGRRDASFRGWRHT